MGLFGQRRLLLRDEFTRSLIRTRYASGVDDLLADWEIEFQSAGLPPAPSRSTLYAWIAEGFPSIDSGPSRDQLLAFCGLLDVDPLALFDFKRNGFLDEFTALRIALARGQLLAGAFRPIIELHQPGESWPSEPLARRYWGRPWSAVEFDNVDRYTGNQYILLKVHFSAPSRGDPRVVHIAYRRWDLGRKDKMWRYYGTVVASDQSLDLYNEGGLHLKMLRHDQDRIDFRTYFGGRPVEFRVASLHEFSLDNTYPFDDMSVIGFNW